MIDRVRIERLWGSDGVVRADPDQLPADVSGELREVLVDVGLPRSLGPAFEPTPVEQAGPTSLRIGHAGDDAAVVEVDLRTGEVTARVEGERMFVNSNLATFLAFLVEIGTVWRDAADEDDQFYADATAALAERLDAIDSPALREGAWWSAIVEEMVIGML